MHKARSMELQSTISYLENGLQLSLLSLLPGQFWDAIPNKDPCNEEKTANRDEDRRDDRPHISKARLIGQGALLAKVAPHKVSWESGREGRAEK